MGLSERYSLQKQSTYNQKTENSSSSHAKFLKLAVMDADGAHNENVFTWVSVSKDY
jgi:hypothetical protein